MRYDFTSIIDRRGMDATALELDAIKGWGLGQEVKPGAELIPMWVADMNFATAPAVTRALQERIAHPLYGYFLHRPEYAQAIIRWQETHHKTTGLTKEAIGYENGVHGCVTSCVQTLSQPDEPVFLHTPYYLGFSADIECIGRVPLRSELKKEEAGVYRMDFEDMDAKLKASNCHLAVFLFPPQSNRPRLGAMGAGKGHGGL